MLSKKSRIFFLSFFTWIFLGFILFYSYFILIDHTNNKEKIIFTIEKNQDSFGIGKKLHQENIIDDSNFFSLTLLVMRYLKPSPSHILAGDYEIKPSTPIIALILTFIHQKVKVFKMTIPEGWSVHQVCARINACEDLVGDIETIPMEGYILPQTYYFSYKSERRHLLKRMTTSMQNVLKKFWHQHTSSLQSPNQALVLASIIEKETALPSEHPLIAGVFLNRLSKNMPLQSDPTVIYALTRGQKELNRLLKRADLKIKDPYNTYWIKGLPPTPICCPSIKALRSVFLPEKTNYLYFVALGSPKDGHVFSTHYRDHLLLIQRKKNLLP
jgi:UPF0755 protein